MDQWLSSWNEHLFTNWMQNKYLKYNVICHLAWPNTARVNTKHYVVVMWRDFSARVRGLQGSSCSFLHSFCLSIWGKTNKQLYELVEEREENNSPFSWGDPGSKPWHGSKPSCGKAHPRIWMRSNTRKWPSSGFELITRARSAGDSKQRNEHWNTGRNSFPRSASTQSGGGVWRVKSERLLACARAHALHCGWTAEARARRVSTVRLQSQPACQTSLSLLLSVMSSACVPLHPALTHHLHARAFCRAKTAGAHPLSHCQSVM